MEKTECYLRPSHHDLKPGAKQETHSVVKLNVNNGVTSFHVSKLSLIYTPVFKSKLFGWSQQKKKKKQRKTVTLLMAKLLYYC